MTFARFRHLKTPHQHSTSLSSNLIKSRAKFSRNFFPLLSVISRDWLNYQEMLITRNRHPWQVSFKSSSIQIESTSRPDWLLIATRFCRERKKCEMQKQAKNICGLRRWRIEGGRETRWDFNVLSIDSLTSQTNFEKVQCESDKSFGEIYDD